MTNAKRGQIPPYALFFLFYISRVVVSLTYIKTICVGVICSDLLISVGISFLLALILSIPAYLCFKYDINPIKKKIIGVLYCAFFIVKTSVNISRFTGFATSRLNPDSTSLFFAFLICVAVCYCAYLGIEGLSRFGVYAGISIMLATLFIIILNRDNINFINLFPLVNNDYDDIALNTVIMTSNSVEIAMLLCLQDHINGDVKKAYFGSLFVQYLTTFVLIFVMICVLGSNASLQSYPIFTLFQMATGNTLSRLDTIHTAFWILAAFVKCTLLIYCSTICIKKFSHKSKCIAFTMISLILSLAMTELFASQIISFAKSLSLVIYLIFCVLIPLLGLIVGKSKRGNRLENNN